MNREYSGYFITLEGGEGCGKTVHVPGLTDRLRDKGLTVYPTREPGGTDIGEEVRILLHDMRYQGIMHPRTETLLFQAARAQFVEENVKTRLINGEIVISDRFFDSTIAYQGYGHRQDIQALIPLVNYATGGLIPDLTVFMDVKVEVGLERKKGQGEWNRLDAYSQDFHYRVREGYLKMVQREPDRWIVVDANPGVEEVFSNLVESVEKRLVKEGVINL